MDLHQATLSVRVTRQGKFRVWVKKALEFLQANPESPLVLYSSPSEVSASAIPKLISVVEIIKREYLKEHLVGLHQFNQLLFEERSRVPLEGESRASAVLLALEGSSKYQPPNVRKLSRAAKARMRQRAKRRSKLE
ncbi:hypothetical protein EDC04DRAFT_2564066 [Pisolithus marmoratus]|nr:hypothetical protein EDC04DRAFT_2564066 [Pisolithus marmoratus]